MLRALPRRTGHAAEPRTGAPLPPRADAGRRPGHLPGPAEPDARRRGGRAEEEARRAQLGRDEGTGEASSRQERAGQVRAAS